MRFMLIWFFSCVVVSYILHRFGFYKPLYINIRIFVCKFVYEGYHICFSLGWGVFQQFSVDLQTMNTLLGAFWKLWMTRLESGKIYTTVRASFFWEKLLFQREFCTLILSLSFSYKTVLLLLFIHNPFLSFFISLLRHFRYHYWKTFIALL